MTADLHAQVIDLFPGEKRCLQRILLHALIDLGHVTVIKCMWKQCVIPDQPLTAEGKRKSSVTWDHTVAVNDGGTDDWRNVQLMHFTCNTRKGALFTDERRVKIGEATRRRWADPDERAKMTEAATAAIRRPEVAAKKSEAMKRHWADPERRAAHTARLARGDAWRQGRNGQCS